MDFSISFFRGAGGHLNPQQGLSRSLLCRLVWSDHGTDICSGVEVWGMSCLGLLKVVVRHFPPVLKCPCPVPGLCQPPSVQHPGSVQAVGPQSASASCNRREWLSHPEEALVLTRHIRYKAASRKLERHPPSLHLGKRDPSHSSPEFQPLRGSQATRTCVSSGPL